MNTGKPVIWDEIKLIDYITKKRKASK